MIKVKICGLTNVDDALAAVDAGAELVGFNFYRPSPRYVDSMTCSAIVAELRSRSARILTCGVFVNASNAEVRAIGQACGLDLLQLHGDEPASALHDLGPAAFKAIRPRSPQEAALALAAYRATRAGSPVLLVDAFKPGAYGGTGAAGDWGLATTVACQVPILLAGGLTAANVQDAIRQVRPWGVDVASGVESAPGRKDRAKMAAFVAAVRQASGELQIANKN